MIFYLNNGRMRPLMPLKMKTLNNRTIVYATGVCGTGDNVLLNRYCFFPDNAGFSEEQVTTSSGTEWQWLKVGSPKAICAYGYNLCVPDSERNPYWNDMTNAPVDSTYDLTQIDFVQYSSSSGQTVGEENCFFFKTHESGVSGTNDTYHNIMCNTGKSSTEKIKLDYYREYDSYLHVRSADINDLYKAILNKGNLVCHYPTTGIGTKSMWKSNPQVYLFDRSSVTRQVKIKPPQGWITLRVDKGAPAPIVKILISSTSDSRCKGARIKDATPQSTSLVSPKLICMSNIDGTGTDLTTNEHILRMSTSHPVYSDTQFDYYAMYFSASSFPVEDREFYTDPYMVVSPPIVMFPSSYVEQYGIYVEVMQWAYLFNSFNIA